MRNIVLVITILSTFRIAGQICLNSSPQYSAGIYPSPVAVSDFNNDGISDIVVGNYSGDQISVLFGNGTGSYNAPVTYPAEGSSKGLIVVDLDKDGFEDLVLCGSSPKTHIFKGLSNGTFTMMASYIIGQQRAVTTGDFNNDGYPDLAFCVPLLYTGSVTILNSTGSGSFGVATGFTVSKGAISIVSGDFNKDGKSDLATAHVVANNISIFQGSGTGSFSFMDSIHVDVPLEIVAMDLNGDALQDIAVATSNLKVGAAVYHNTSAGGFSLSSNYTVTGFPTSLALVDLDKDGYIDIAASLSTPNNDPGIIAVFKGTAAGSFSQISTFTTHPLPVRIATGDVNNDGWSDLAVTYNSNNYVSTMMNCFVTGVNDQFPEIAANIWPNPASGRLTTSLGIKGDYTLSFIDVHGVKVRSQMVRDDAPFSLHGIPAGIYTLVIRTEHGSTYKKLLVTGTD